MPLGKIETSSTGGPGLKITYNMELVNEEMRQLEKDRNMLRGILEGQYDEFTSPDVLNEEADKLRNNIAARKKLLEAYEQSEPYRKALQSSEPTKTSVSPSEMETYTGKKIPTKGGPFEVVSSKEADVAEIKKFLQGVSGKEIPNIEEKLSRVLGKETPSVGKKLKGGFKMGGGAGKILRGAEKFAGPASLFIDPVLTMAEEARKGSKGGKELMADIEANTPETVKDIVKEAQISNRLPKPEARLSPEERLKIKELIKIKRIPSGSYPVGDAGFYKTPEGKLVQTKFLKE